MCTFAWYLAEALTLRPASQTYVPLPVPTFDSAI